MSKKIFKTAANFVLPGAGIVGGALNGLIQGGGLKGALLGGATSGLQQAAAPLFNNLTGSITGGLGDALKGSGFASGSGLSGVGSALSGIGSTVTKGLSDIGSALGTGVGGGSSAYNIGGALLGGLNSERTNRKALKQLTSAQQQAMSELNPYLSSGAAANTRLSELLGTGGDPNAAGYGSLAKPFTPQDLQNDPGYQFQLEQGTNAINRSLGARGKVFSGEALRAATEYGTGLADQTYKDAFNRDLASRGQLYGQFAGQAGAGQQAAGSAADLYGTLGTAKAASTIASGNNQNQLLSALLTGSGARQLIGYDASGKPIYA